MLAVWILTFTIAIVLVFCVVCCLVVSSHCDKKWDEANSNETPCKFCVYRSTVNYACATCRISDDGLTYKNYIGKKPIEEIGCGRFTNGNKRRLH